MSIRLGFLVACASVFPASAVLAADEDNLKISIQVPPGAPLRVYLTRRLPKRLGAPVEAKVMEPVFAFDREVVPAGTVAQGTVSRVRPASRWQRVRAILNGDFTPLRSAEVEFTSLTLPDGRTLATHTVQAPAMNSIYTEPPKHPKRQKSQPQNQNNGILGTVKQAAKDQAYGAINARTRGISDIVRAPNKKEKLVDMFWAKLPYHPQYYRRGTRFDAPLRDSLEFGIANIRPVDIAAPGTQPRPDTVVRVRLLTALDSASAKPGEPVQAVVAAPLFSPEHKLVLPEGTQLTGIVVMARKARSFHRAGQLRFNFQKVDLPPELANLRPAAPLAPMQTQASVAGAEGNGTTPIEVDSEGGVQAKESKTRFIAPVISLMLASRAADNDAGHHHDTGASGDPNIGGRTLGGGLGFGMLGSALAQSSRYVGMAFGYYGLAWSVYSSVVARGGEVQFDKNAMMDIKFGARAPKEASKFREVASVEPTSKGVAAASSNSKTEDPTRKLPSIEPAIPR
jgi:hypothetical protein